MNDEQMLWIRSQYGPRSKQPTPGGPSTSDELDDEEQLVVCVDCD